MLSQASLSRYSFTFVEVWWSNTDLELIGELVKEWDNYMKALSGAGMTLQEDSKDLLIWTGGNTSGRMTAKNFYNAILTTHGLPRWRSWKVKV
jgi:hypothetical protein